MAIALKLSERALLEGKHFGTLTTITPKGIPYQVPAWYMLTATDIVITALSTTLQLRHIRRMRWATLAINDGPRALLLRGRAIVDTEPETVIPTFRAIIMRYIGSESADQWITNVGGNEGHRAIIHIPLESISMPRA